MASRPACPRGLNITAMNKHFEYRSQQIVLYMVLVQCFTEHGVKLPVDK